MKEPNFGEKNPKMGISGEKEEIREEIRPEYILYHNAIHFELREGELVDFFAPKSEMTRRINNAFGEAVRQISEIQTLIKSDKFQGVKRLLLDTDDVYYSDGRRQDIIKGLNKLLEEENLPEVKKLLNESGDIVNLRWLIEDQLGKKDAPTDILKLSKLKEIRDQSYFLTKEDESFRGWDLVSFDIRKLLDYGFEIYEANNETADSIARGFSSIHEIRRYLDSLRKINSPEDCLKYSTELEDDYDACTTRVVYKPYCPEYLIQPPTPEFITQLIKDKKDKLSEIISKYRITPPYHKRYGYENEVRQLVKEEFEEGEDIDIDNLDPQNPEDYHLIVEVLFNESIINIKLAKGAPTL